MKTSKDKRKFLVYTSLFVPIFLVSCEAFLAGFSYIRGISMPIGNPDKNAYDLINGWRNVSASEKSDQHPYNNKHAFIKTPYLLNANDSNNVKGVLITGNSVAMGFPIVKSNYQNTFVSQLETSLRKEDDLIDFVNLSHSGYNSWQEFVEAVRYLNSSPLHDDLPNNITLIASLGGIQDFWNFLDVLNTSNQPMNEYYKANGLMSWKLRDDQYLDQINKIGHGSIKSAIELLINTITLRLKRYTNTYYYLSNLKKHFISFNSKPINLEPKTKNTKKINSNRSLAVLINRKFKISLEEYNYKKDYVINSVLRNIKSLSNLNEEGKYLYVYLPSKFSSLSTTKDSTLVKHGLSLSDLHLIEKDYRTSLFEAFDQDGSLAVSDFGQLGNDSWYDDISHYSLHGQAKLTEYLKPLFSNTID